MLRILERDAPGSDLAKSDARITAIRAPFWCGSKIDIPDTSAIKTYWPAQVTASRVFGSPLRQRSLANLQRGLMTLQEFLT